LYFCLVCLGLLTLVGIWNFARRERAYHYHFVSHIAAAQQDLQCVNHTVAARHALHLTLTFSSVVSRLSFMCPG
jgi:hypothetical protein